MLSSAIKGYQNKVLTAAEVIDELIKLAKAIQESDKMAEELNLTEYEYAFYSAVADNDSARELMQKEILRELAVVLTESIRKNVMCEKNIEKAAENLKFANEAFEAGLVGSTDVMEAQTAWLSANSESIDSSIEVKLCELYLKKALGQSVNN